MCGGKVRAGTTRIPDLGPCGHLLLTVVQSVRVVSRQVESLSSLAYPYRLLVQMAVQPTRADGPHGTSRDVTRGAICARAGFHSARGSTLRTFSKCFRNTGRIGRRRFPQNESSFRISNKGLEITLPVVRRRLCEGPTQSTVTLGILDCKYDGCSEVLALVMN